MEPLDSDEQEKLLDALVERHVPEGTDIITQGKPNNTFYIIKGGGVKVLQKAEFASVQLETKRMRKIMFALFGTAPLSLVQIQCVAETRHVYPRGWLAGYMELLRRDVVRKIVLGAEHTIAIGQKGIYAWGSDEVGQLGIGDRKSVV